MFQERERGGIISEGNHTLSRKLSRELQLLLGEEPDEPTQQTCTPGHQLMRCDEDIQSESVQGIFRSFVKVHEFEEQVSEG